MGRRVATVSFFGVPDYVQNSELSINKLKTLEWSSWQNGPVSVTRIIQRLKGVLFIEGLNSRTQLNPFRMPQELVKTPFKSNIMDNLRSVIFVCRTIILWDHAHSDYAVFLVGLLGHLRHDCPDDRVLASESDYSDGPDPSDDSMENLSSEDSLDGSGELVIDEETLTTSSQENVMDGEVHLRINQPWHQDQVSHQITYYGGRVGVGAPMCPHPLKNSLQDGLICWISHQIASRPFG